MTLDLTLKGKGPITPRIPALRFPAPALTVHRQPVGLHTAIMV